MMMRPNPAPRLNPRLAKTERNGSDAFHPLEILALLIPLGIAAYLAVRAWGAS